MDETEQKLPDVFEEQVSQQPSLPADQPIRVPMYRRDFQPTNLALSAEDLKKFCELLVDGPDPILNGLSNELRAVVRTDVSWHTPHD